MKKYVCWAAVMLAAGVGAFDDFSSYNSSGEVQKSYMPFDANNPYPQTVELVTDPNGDNKFLRIMPGSATAYTVVARQLPVDKEHGMTGLKFKVRTIDMPNAGVGAQVGLRPSKASPDAVAVPLPPASGEFIELDVQCPEAGSWNEAWIIISSSGPMEQAKIEFDDFKLLSDAQVIAAQRQIVANRKAYSERETSVLPLNAASAKYVANAELPLPELTEADGKLQISSGAEWQTAALTEFANPLGKTAAGVEFMVENLSPADRSGVLYAEVFKVGDLTTPLAAIKVFPRHGRHSYQILVPELADLDKFVWQFRTARMDMEEWADAKFSHQYHGSQFATSKTIGAPVKVAVSDLKLLPQDKVCSIIPMPRMLTMQQGTFELLPRSAIVADEKSMAVAGMLRESLMPATGFTLPVVAEKLDYPTVIELKIDENLLNELGKEGYKLNISADKVQLQAAADAGLFYAVQSLRQLFPADIMSSDFVNNSWVLPCLAITDYPEYSWRGMHLDTARHYFPKAYIMKYIDLLAMQKMNIFHWHYNDGDAWRIESKVFPKLTEVGAWWGNGYNGFYTQDDVKEILAYAKARHVTVIPEVEMPAHNNAALVAYPEVSCQPMSDLRGTPDRRDWFFAHQPLTAYCPSNPATYEFLEKLLTETAELFPDAPAIHVGGDELPVGAWLNCPRCKKFMAEKGFKTEAELQNYFTGRIEQIVHKLNRRIIGWEQIMNNKLDDTTIVLAYLSQSMAVQAAEAGYDVINGNAMYSYYDFYQGMPEDEPFAIGGHVTVESIYSYNPRAGVPAAAQHHILGGQGAMWAEYIARQQQSEYQVFPRSTTLAEALWTPAAVRDYNSFTNRLNRYYDRLDFKNVKYKDYRNNMKK